MIGWMNNWQYANQVPTSPWRSAMSVPREVGLRTVDGRPQLVQQPVASLDTLETGQRQTESNTTITGERTLTKRGDVLDIRATLRPGSASRMGLKVLTNANGDETVVSYDVAAGTLSIDRTKSGAAAAALAGFPGVHSAPVALRDGRLNLRILVDRSLVEVFAQDGERTIADQVYPTPGSDGLKVFADRRQRHAGNARHPRAAHHLGRLGNQHPRRRRRHRARHALAHARTGSQLRPLPARRHARLRGIHDRQRHLHRRRRDAHGGRPEHQPPRPARQRQRSSCRSPSRSPAPRSRRRSRPGPSRSPTTRSPIPFTQSIAATDALRTGTYSKTLTFTLSTTTP